MAASQQLVLRNRTISETASVIIAQVNVNGSATEDQVRLKQEKLKGTRTTRNGLADRLAAQNNYVSDCVSIVV